ncbi:hypothetical protein D3C87_347230 [compost metagenome]
MLNYYEMRIVFQEVPDEISLAFGITGCQLRCKGCHSPFSWPAEKGEPLTEGVLVSALKAYEGMISTVLFMGGEWDKPWLIGLLQRVQEMGLSTALYTGLDEVDADLMAHLTYLKTGRWEPERGGLSSPTTNQRLLHVPTGKDITFLFKK